MHPDVSLYIVCVHLSAWAGGYGYVYLARDAANERVQYALKKLLARDATAEASALREIDVMVRFSSHT